jgi:hypothetical protein
MRERAHPAGRTSGPNEVYGEKRTDAVAPPPVAGMSTIAYIGFTSSCTQRTICAFARFPPHCPWRGGSGLPALSASKTASGDAWHQYRKKTVGGRLAYSSPTVVVSGTSNFGSIHCCAMTPIQPSPLPPVSMSQVACPPSMAASGLARQASRRKSATLVLVVVRKVARCGSLSSPAHTLSRSTDAEMGTVGILWGSSLHSS